MPEHPILFSGPMVQAIREGQKSVTRRVIKPQPPDGLTPAPCHYSSTGWALQHASGRCECGAEVRCPYGVPGDHLWVREATRIDDRATPAGYQTASYVADGQPVLVDGKPCRWFGKRDYRPPMFMPRVWSRILLTNKSVRVERVQDITEEGAKAEGCWDMQDADGSSGWGAGTPAPQQYTYRNTFRHLWDSINSKRGFSWEFNPLVFVVEFS